MRGTSPAGNQPSIKGPGLFFTVTGFNVDEQWVREQRPANRLVLHGRVALGVQCQCLARASEAQVGALNQGILPDRSAASTENQFARLDHVGAVGNLQGQMRVLFDQKNGGSELL